MTLKEAVKKSLDERWIPIKKAKTIDEIRSIKNTTKCYMCEYCKDRDLSCINCPALVEGKCCNGEWYGFFDALLDNSFWIAHEYAVKIINRLKSIKCEE